MASSSTPADPASLSELFGTCMDAFRKLLLALGEEDCRVVRLEQVHLPAILEEYGRAKIWGDQTKADLPARTRGSLDDTLRHDDDLKQLVRGVFMRLSALLVQATSIAEKKYDPIAGSDYDSVSSVSAESSSDDSDNEGDARRTMPKIRLLAQQIIGQIRSLYDLSSLLRRPKIADKYIRSVNSKAEKSASAGTETLALSVGFRTSDENHIIEKVMQWRGLTKSDLSVEFEEEVVSPVDTGKGLTRDGVEDILWFCQRLARANTRRREQLQYWTSHPYVPQGDTPSTQLPSQEMAPVPLKRVEEAEELRSQTSTLKPPDVNLPCPGPRSAMSKQSFSTAAVSLVHDTKTNVRPRTVYAPTAIGKGRSNSVPDPPKAKDDSDTFPCPYCGMTLEYGEMQNRQSWQRHVFRDLRPYVCTFEDCHNAGKLYVSRHDWAHHELQVHRREYLCKECDKRCSTRLEASTHLREHYGVSVLPVQLSIILDLSERQVDVSLDQKEPCLVCGEELSLMALQGHLAGHMEDSALFVLPSAEEDDATGGSNDSLQVAKLESGGKGSDLGSDSTSLGFHASEDHGQSPLDFAKILEDGEAGYAAKFSSWEADSEDGTSTSRTQPDGSKKANASYPRRLEKRIVIIESSLAAHQSDADAETPTLSTRTDEDQREEAARIKRRDIAHAIEANVSCTLESWYRCRPKVSTARMAAVSGADDDGTSVVWGYLFPFDFMHDDFLVLKSRTASPERDTVVTGALDGNERVTLPNEKPSARYLIGRNPECASGRHFSVALENNGGNNVVILEDLSSNGTSVNSSPVGFSGRRALEDDDVIRIAENFGFVFKVPERQPTRTFTNLYTIGEDLSYSVLEMPPPGSGQGEWHPRINHTIEGFQRQLLLLGQQLKKRLMISLQRGGEPSTREHYFRCFEKSTSCQYMFRKITKTTGIEAARDKLALESHEKQEIRILAHLNHANLPHVKDAFADSTAAYIVFDMDPESNLSSSIVRRGKLSQEEARHILKRVFSAVQYLHSRGIIHRNISPDNVVILRGNQHVKLANFDWAGVTKGESFFTRDGNPAYPAPEIVEYKMYTKALDVWSLGMMLYICLCGFDSFFDTAPYMYTVEPLGKETNPCLVEVSTSAIDLLNSMVVVDPERRLTIQECIDHPWMSET